MAAVEMPADFDPYGDRDPVYHKAHLHDGKGGVSPLCAKKPRRLNLRTDTWTIRWEAVTCKKCLALKSSEGVAGG